VAPGFIHQPPSDKSRGLRPSLDQVPERVTLDMVTGARQLS
jgi:hypothetical protein